MDTLYRVSENCWLPGLLGGHNQKRKKGARSLIYLTGEDRKSRFLRPNQPKTRPTHDQFPNPDNLLPRLFSSSLSASLVTSASPTADLLPSNSSRSLHQAILSKKKICETLSTGLRYLFVLYLHHFPPLLKPFLKYRSSSRFNSVWCRHSRTYLLEHGSPRQY